MFRGWLRLKFRCARNLEMDNCVCSNLVFRPDLCVRMSSFYLMSLLFAL